MFQAHSSSDFLSELSELSELDSCESDSSITEEEVVESAPEEEPDAGDVEINSTKTHPPPVISVDERLTQTINDYQNVNTDIKIRIFF